MVEDKENNKPSGNLKTEKSFLRRWSKKKAASKDIGNLTKVDSNNDEQKKQINKTNEESEEEKLSIDELANKYEVANPETLDSSVDLKEFMQKKLPDRLRQLALRRLWKVVPIYGEVSELVEYGEDFTDAATVVDGLQTAYVVGKGYVDKVIEKTDKVAKQIEKNKKSNNKVSKKVNKKHNKTIKSSSSKKINIEKDKTKQSKNITPKQTNHSDEEINNLSNDESIEEFDKMSNETIRPGKMVFKKNQQSN